MIKGLWVGHKNMGRIKVPGQDIFERKKYIGWIKVSNYPAWSRSDV